MSVPRKQCEIKDYDEQETTSWINPQKRLSLKNLGFKLPPTPPSQVLSIRLPTHLLNRIRAKVSQQDVPYQALIKMILSRSLKARY